MTSPSPNQTTPTHAPVPTSHPSSHRATRAGILFGLAAYGFWGITPIYFKALTGDYYHLLNGATVPAIEILAHRIVWSVVFLAFILTMRKQWGELIYAVRTPKTLITLIITTGLIGINWFVFIWAVGHGRILETSLGYYMNPLVNVFLGMVFLRERLRIGGWIALSIAAVGVGILTLAGAEGDHFPWIAILLAFSFGMYGLLRKIAPVNGVPGLAFETMLLAPIALGFLIHLANQGEGHFLTVNMSADTLLIAAGLVTIFPLICFANAARRLRLSTLGFLQYVAPTENFLLGVFMFGESVTPARWVAFAFIWVALAIYSADTARHSSQIATGKSNSANKQEK